MGSASSRRFLEEPRLSSARHDLAAASLEDDRWIRTSLAQHFEGQLLDVDLVDEFGTPTSSVKWTFARWFAAASCRNAFASHGRLVRPYIRNVPVPPALRRQCLSDSPWPTSLGLDVSCTLFMGSPGSRTWLHTDGVHSAVLVLRGQKLVVALAPDSGGGLSASEATALNAVLCGLADRAPESFGGGGAGQRAGAHGVVDMGNLALRYAWLGPGEAITIPRGWHHFVYNETSCISVTLWARPPRPAAPVEPSSAAAEAGPAAPGAAPQAAPAAGPGMMPGSGRLLKLPRRLLQHVVSWCLDAAEPLGSSACGGGAGPASRLLWSVACSDAAWEAAFRHHWGTRAAALAAAEAAEAAAEAPGAASAEGGWRRRYARIRRVVAGEFKERPKAAARRWGDLALVDPGCAEALAGFLHRHERLLDKGSLGDYLSSPHAVSVLEAWTRELLAPLSGISVEAALRIYLLSLRLPGEAPRIDRMFQILASAYCSQNPGILATAAVPDDSQNPGIFASEDVIFVMLFNLVILNADLTTRTIKHHMTLDQFLRNNRGINDGADLPREYLTELFESIRQTPLPTC
uniref:JmjC domain-containing protein n=1 Tax=Alexandrium monilatum TaxID=311494 RepID=A0A7S4QHD4_9DINO|mmetsp:Transcript_19380/g.60795  ORF Transcript_19380/g.60795 Transcript_19380/m.60795 type:complete len:575 (-) Transcript_19380:260-1984(-)